MKVSDWDLESLSLTAKMICRDLPVVFGSWVGREIAHGEAHFHHFKYFLPKKRHCFVERLGLT